MASGDAVRRRPRGERRRHEILLAALRIVRERGTAAVTHRAVAEVADVPPATTTYYFDSIDELLEEALKLFVDEEVERLGHLAASLRSATVSPHTISELFAEELLRGNESGDNVAQFELYLEASRRPRLHEAAAACLRAYAEAAEAALAAAGAARASEGARTFVALVDGLALARTAAPDSHHDADELARAMRDLFIGFAMDEDERAAWERRMGEPTAQGER
ncbi:MAG: TetR family transcriptional regulator [Thermoleophilaceae bacterium]